MAALVQEAQRYCLETARRQSLPQIERDYEWPSNVKCPSSSSKVAPIRKVEYYFLLVLCSNFAV